MIYFKKSRSTFMLYAVLESNVEMAKGKSIICKYESTFDAPQKAYADLTDNRSNSHTASLISTRILSYITLDITKDW
jgi:hypothetical protein